MLGGALGDGALAELSLNSELLAKLRPKCLASHPSLAYSEYQCLQADADCLLYVDAQHALLGAAALRSQGRLRDVRDEAASGDEAKLLARRRQKTHSAGVSFCYRRELFLLA